MKQNAQKHKQLCKFSLQCLVPMSCNHWRELVEPYMVLVGYNYKLL